ncbi:MAG: single-stranded DNA-binding protein [Acidimicrobiia bacterium]|nr:single-stranded DNA-binding protein [Acidimicrobiia bacterium]
MDMNTVVLFGRLAAPPEVREFESGSSLVRSLITVRSNAPRRRVDVLPVTLWDPDPGHELLSATAGMAVYAVGSVQRRFWSTEKGRASRLEIVALHAELAPNQTEAATGSAG